MSARERLLGIWDINLPSSPISAKWVDIVFIARNTSYMFV